MALRLMGGSRIPKVSRYLFFMSAPSGPNYGFCHLIKLLRKAFKIKKYRSSVFSQISSLH